MAFQANAFQGFQASAAVAEPAEVVTGGSTWHSKVERPRTKEDRERELEELRQDRIRFGVLPPDEKPAAAMAMVAKQAAMEGWSEQIRLLQAQVELEALGRQLNEQYLQQLQQQYAQQQQRMLQQHALVMAEMARQARIRDDEEAILVLMMS